VLYVFELFVVFIIGGAVYGLIELLYRGHTHWTMIIAGGICFSFLYLISTKTNWNLLVQCLAGAAFITAVEFIVGCIVNLWLRWDVWDYSEKRYNILGQVCPVFMVYWLLLCLPGILLANVISIMF